MKSLVLAEKPSVARDIARVLKCHKNLPGAIEGNSYVTGVFFCCKENVFVAYQR